MQPREVFPVLNRYQWLIYFFVILTACQPDSIVEVGIVQFFGESEDVIEAPDTATVDEPFFVTVNTYGAKCYSADSMTMESSGDVLELVPYDRQDTSYACPAVQVRLKHTADVVFPTSGTKILRVRGRRVEQQDDTLIELDKEIVVEE